MIPLQDFDENDLKALQQTFDTARSIICDAVPTRRGNLAVGNGSPRRGV
jgi:hypothetical protein